MGRIANKTRTDKQSAFIKAYVSNGFNATKAAIAAGYGKARARVTGAELVAKCNIASAIRERLDDGGITTGRIECEIAQIAFETDIADYEDLLYGRCSLKELREVGVDTRNIRKIKATRRIVGRGEDAEEFEDVTIELQDRQAALEKLARIHAMFIDKLQTDLTSAGKPFLGLTEEEYADIARKRGGPAE